MKMRLFALLLTVVVLVSAANAEEFFFESDGVPIRYVIEGEGEPLVLIHGFTASVEANWKGPGIFAPLAAEYKVIALDCRGHGKSGKPRERDAYGAQMAKDVVNLLDHLEIEQAHIAGYSMGGIITLNILINYPERCLSAIVGGAGWNDPEAGGIELADAIAESLEQGEGLKALIVGLTPAGRPVPSDEQIKAMSALILGANDPLTLAAVARGFRGLEVTREQIERNAVPTLGIVGSLDPLLASAEAMRANMPNVQGLVILENGDHMTALGNPNFPTAMLEFLRAHSPALEAAGR
jgi:pimeloyl-ACP methyl ester carboxylesterase